MKACRAPRAALQIASGAASVLGRGPGAGGLRRKERGMAPKLKIVGLALTAALAMSALMVSAPRAEEGKTGELTATKYPVSITAPPHLKQHTFTAGGQTITCKGPPTTFSGTISAKTKELTITPSYKECHTPTGFEATVTMNGCDYLFTTGTKTGEEFTGSVHLICPAGKRVEIHAVTCKITVLPTHETNAGPPHSLTKKYALKGEILLANIPPEGETKAPFAYATLKVEGITYETHKGFLCPMEGDTETKADGVYHGNSRVKGWEHGFAHTATKNEVGLEID
jgi:hypothetical protein